MTELIGYHVERNGLFLCDDKHADKTWWGSFNDVFCVRFWEIKNALRYKEPGDIIRVSIDGKLV